MRHDSFVLLTKYATDKVRCGQLDEALHAIHDFVERIITEPMCTSQVYGSKTLDSLCQSIGKACYVQLDCKNAVNRNGQRAQPIVVYVVTKLQKSGGHTRVIEDFIKAKPDAQHVILSTELIGKSDADYLSNRLVKLDGTSFEPAPKASFQQRLMWLQQRLLQIQPNKTYLFNHHQDSVAVAAIQPEMKLDASFYHHGDHHLCLGVYLSHLDHIDFHPMGYHNCRDVLGIDNTYIPLTVEDRGERPASWPFFHGEGLTTCTAAKSNKIEIPYFVSYMELVPKLLQATGGRHIHIGRLTPWALFKIRQGLKRSGIQVDRFIYMPWVPSVWKALHDYRVDLYVASFPYGGGLTLIEAMGAGIPVALHRHIFSRVLSGIDIAYVDAFSWRAPDELLDYCVSLTPEKLDKASRSGRMQYEKFHSSQILPGVLSDKSLNHPKPAELSDTFSVETDEWALWMEQQLTIKRVFSRVVYRAFRRFRAWW